MQHHLIFDFDGVIGDTREASARATAVVDGTDYETALASNLAYASNKPRHVRNHVLTDSEMHKIYSWTQQFGKAMHEAGFPLFTEFVAEIEALPTPHKAIVSSGSQLYVIPALATTSINPTHILAFEDHHSKEEKIELICADWGVSTKDVFYFTDTLADVYELQEMLSEDKLIGVAWGYCRRDALLQVLKPEHILDTPGDLSVLLAT
jgi:phosphoglycolate phosphatase-like HAD superfamily hydrolase